MFESQDHSSLLHELFITDNNTHICAIIKFICYFQKQSLAFYKNIRLGQKCLIATNTLAYYTSVL